MPRLVMLTAAFLAALGIGAAAQSTPPEAAAPASVHATIAPVKVKDGGHLIVAIYNDKDSWLKLDRALAKQTVSADADTIRVTFDSIAAGTYALMVIHDKNDNGKFDMRWFPWPKPKEGAGVSNNHTRKGKPEYEKALFEVADRPVSLSIQLNY